MLQRIRDYRHRPPKPSAREIVLAWQSREVHVAPRPGTVPNALVLHGSGESPESHWFSWLANQLAWRGWQVEVPELAEPDLDAYWAQLADYPFDERTVLVGHGAGATMAFGVLHRMEPNIRIRQVVAVAPFYRDDSFGAEGLFTEEYDWQKIRRQVERIELLWEHGDPLIADDQVSVLSEKLGVAPLLVDDGAAALQLDMSPRARQFPEVLDLVLAEG